MGVSIKEMLELTKAGYKTADIKNLISLADDKTPVSELIELAKAGNKVEDIKELITLSEAGTTESPKEQQGAAAAQTKPKTESPDPKGEPEKGEPGANADEVDYKKLYEQSQEDLKKAQTDNLNKDNSGSAGNVPDPVEGIKDIIRTYM